MRSSELDVARGMSDVKLMPQSTGDDNTGLSGPTAVSVPLTVLAATAGEQSVARCTPVYSPGYREYFARRPTDVGLAPGERSLASSWPDRRADMASTPTLLPPTKELARPVVIATRIQPPVGIRRTHRARHAAVVVTATSKNRH
jgi:hypothetical protein